MQLAKFYLDTNMWNRLHEQRIDVQLFHPALQKRGAGLAVSGQTLCELARTFEKNPQKGIELFQYLKGYIDLGIIAAHDNMEQLHGEIRALNTGETDVIVFYGRTEYAEFQTEVDKLAQGIFDETAQTFIAGRRHFAKTSRADQVSHFTVRSELKDRLNSVGVRNLEQ